MQPEQTHPRPRGFRRRLLGDIFHGVKRYLILGVAATLCATFLTYVTPLVVSFTVDSVIGDKTPELPAALSALFQRMGGRAYFSSHIWVLASLVVLVTLLGGVFTYLRGHCIAFAGEGLAKRLRDRLFTHLEAVPYSYHVGVQTGDLVQRCTSDVETVRRFVQMQAMEVVRTVVMVCTAISIMLPISGAMTAVSTCLLPILVVFSFFYFRGVQRQFTRSDEAEGALSTTLQENLTGVRVVRAFAQESSELDKFTRRNKAYHDITLHLTTLMGAYWGLSDMIGYLQIALSGVCGVYFAVHGGFSLGNVLLFTTYTSMLTFPMRQLGRILADLGKADISLSRLEDILAVPAEAEPGKALTPQIDGSVAFEDVCFDYGDGVPCFPMFRSPYGPARPLASSAARARANPAWCSFCSGCTPSPPDASRFPVLTSTTSNAITCAATWASFCRNRSCTAAPSAKTSPSPGRTRIFRTYMPPRARPRYMTSSRASPRATTPWSASAA